jgi:hypothetical protein
MHTLPYLSQANRVPCFFSEDTDSDQLKHNGLGFASGVEIIFDWHCRSDGASRIEH